VRLIILAKLNGDFFVSNSRLDEFYMRMALELAAKGLGRTSPNPMVGAVLVKEGQVVGQGYHLKAGASHAEVVAIQQAGDFAKGAALYVNLEPCCHAGRTGPCTEVLLAAGVSRVIVAMVDPNPLVAGQGLERLKSAGVEVKTGVLAEDARNLNEVFIKYITTGKPFVTLKVAMSLDGKIAASSGESKWITGEAARRYVHQLRDRYDAILVGVGTILADNPSLDTRLQNGKGKNPVRIVVDSTLRTPLNSKIFKRHSPARVILATTKSASSNRLKAFLARGAEVMVIAGEGPMVSLDRLMKELGQQEITSILIEGGAKVNASALEEGIIDKVVWFIAPKIIGGEKAPGPVGGLGIDRLAAAKSLDRITVKRIEEDICIEGYLRY